MWRGDWRAPEKPTHYEVRLQPMIEALKAEQLDVEPVVYFDESADVIRELLLGFDGVLVWINPLADGRDRSLVDAILREVAASGVWVSAHPDVIAKMGVKDVLYHTRGLGWGSDTDLYTSFADYCARFESRLARAGPRVLKPHRGNDGHGVMKVEATDQSRMLRVQHASDDRVEEMTPDMLAERLRSAFSNGGRIIDQAFHPNVSAGMVRCYMSMDRVVGFAEQRPRAEDASSERPAFGMNSSKAMHGPDMPALRDLREHMESEWVPGLQSLLGIQTTELPALWDADFLVRAAVQFVLNDLGCVIVSGSPGRWILLRLCLGVRAIVHSRVNFETALVRDGASQSTRTVYVLSVH
jgi:hypothetical protein